jgi:hypothetical protein
MEIVTEPQFRTLTNGKSVFFTNYSARDGVVIKFTDSSLIVVHNNGPLSATCIDYFDNENERRAIRGMIEYAKSLPPMK